jgi:murein DD-endopeptidase MepM/ murein hydrolase activator NlpD
MERESTSFDPRTWVSAEPLRRQDSEPVPPNDEPDSAPKRFRPIWAIAPLALAAIGAAAFYFWPWAASEPAKSIEAKTRPVAASLPSPSTPDAGSVRVINVSGFAELDQALEAMGVPGNRATAIARAAIEALGTEEEMRVAVELIGSGTKTSVRTITAELGDGTTIRLTRKKSGTFERENVLDDGETRVRSASGTIQHNTFYASAVDAGVPNGLITEFAKAFSFDFDFQREVQIGDKFSATWVEKVSTSGRTVAPPELLYVELESAGKSRKYYAFTPPSETELRWFTEEGKGAQRGLMRTPVDGARITSKYGYRTHPISRVQKKHNGIDFAAPTGTPIYASGDATVVHRAYSGGAGNLIKLDHGDGMQTWYMHLSKFADTLVLGEPVRQGQIIGYVGSTGASTGPHLHYEIRLAGTPTDPLTHETTEVEALTGAALRMFRSRRDETKAGMHTKS